MQTKLSKQRSVADMFVKTRATLEGQFHHQQAKIWSLLNENDRMHYQRNGKDECLFDSGAKGRKVIFSCRHSEIKTLEIKPHRNQVGCLYPLYPGRLALLTQKHSHAMCALVHFRI